jgi:hypothetical protein
MSRKAVVPIDECLFGKDLVSLADLRRIASQGIVDQGSHRAVAWRVLLGYLPEDRQEWPCVLEKKRKHYLDLINEVFSCAQDNGNELRGHHGKRAAQRRQQREEERKQREEEEKRKTDDINDVLVKLEDTVVSSEQNKTGESNGEILETRKEDIAQRDMSTKAVSESSENPNDRREKEVLPAPNGLSECVPQRIREQWKKSGRDSNVLVEMSNGHYNTLLVVDNQGKAMSTFSKKHSDEDKWLLFYENAALLDEIRKDVIRTHPDLYFFLEPEDNLGQRRYAAMERILFVWAKRNIGVSIHMCVCVVVILLLSMK